MNRLTCSSRVKVQSPYRPSPTPDKQKSVRFERIYESNFGILSDIYRGCENFTIS